MLSVGPKFIDSSIGHLTGGGLDKATGLSSISIGAHQVALLAANMTEVPGSVHLVPQLPNACSYHSVAGDVYRKGGVVGISAFDSFIRWSQELESRDADPGTAVIVPADMVIPEDRQEAKISASTESFASTALGSLVIKAKVAAVGSSVEELELLVSAKRDPLTLDRWKKNGNQPDYPASYLAHVVTAGVGDDREFRAVNDAVFNVLKLTSPTGRVVIPALGTGVESSLTPRQSAQAILNAVFRSSVSGAGPRQEIVIAVLPESPEALAAFQTVMQDGSYLNVEFGQRGERPFDPEAYRAQKRKESRQSLDEGGRAGEVKLELMYPTAEVLKMRGFNLPPRSGRES